MLNESTIIAKRSLLSKTFRSQLEKLPPSVREITSKKYFRWRKDPQTLNFENKFKNVFAIEVTRLIHAICEIDNGVVYWMWIGKYDQYAAQLNIIRTRLGAEK
jgi:hypothetical protein